MGSRANYVVVDDDGWQLYYSHWGAQSIHRALAAGPADALRFVRAQHRWDHEWLDDRWAEGGALLDLPRRLLLWFGGEEMMELAIRRAFFPLLAQTWPGWTVRFAYDGLAELARHVGVDPAVVAVPGRGTVRADAARPVTDDYVTHCYWALFTERVTATVVRDKALDNRPHPGWAGRRLLDLGPSASAAVATYPPVGGVHVDHVARRVGWWVAEEEPELRAVMVREWAGWDVEFWDDDYERHVAEAGLSLPPIDVAAGFDRLLDDLTREYSDPVALFGSGTDALREAGHTVEVTAPTSAHVEVERSAQTHAAVVAALAAARRSLGL